MATTTPADPQLTGSSPVPVPRYRQIGLPALIQQRRVAMRNLSWEALAARAGKQLDENGRPKARISPPSFHNYANTPLNASQRMPPVDKMHAMADALSDPPRLREDGTFGPDFDGVVVTVEDVVVAAAASLGIHVQPALPGSSYRPIVLGERSAAEVAALHGAAPRA